MKVCVVTTWFPSKAHPNIAPFVYNFAKNLGRSGVSVSVITTMDKSSPYVLKQDFMIIYRIMPRRFALISMLNLLKQIKPDIVHVHAPNLFTSNAIVASKVRRTPVIASVYRGEIDAIDPRIKAPLRSLLFKLRRFALNRFDRIIALSNFSKSLALRAGAKEDMVTVIYNSCEETIFNPKDKLTSRKICNIAFDKMIILFVGNLIRLKGLYTLIEAVKILDLTYPNRFLVVIIGQGEERKNLESIVDRHNLADKLKFMGWLPQADLAYFYNAADVFVLPSFVEGHSIALLEAMASGLPIVASDIEGNRESIQDSYNGLLFESGNSKMLAERLETVLTNSQLRQQMSTTNLRLYFEKFSTKAQIDNYLNIYRSLLKSDEGQKNR